MSDDKVVGRATLMAWEPGPEDAYANYVISTPVFEISPELLVLLRQDPPPELTFTLQVTPKSAHIVMDVDSTVVNLEDVCCTDSETGDVVFTEDPPKEKTDD